MYNYVRSRQLEGTYPGTATTGVWISTSLRIKKGWGVPSEDDWPYDGDAAHWPPKEPPEIDAKAKAKRIFAYQRANSVEDFRLILAGGNSVVVALTIDESWSKTRDGVIEKPVNQPSIGSHTVLLCGYDDVRKTFVFQNSWGKSWGDRGFGHLPYEYFPSRFIEGWSNIHPRPPSSSTGSAGITVATWAIPDLLGRTLHGVEIVDRTADEMIGWGFSVERHQFLEIEELFVRPNWRRRGYAKEIGKEFTARANQLNRKLRTWIPHSDIALENSTGLSGVMRNLGIQMRATPVNWAADCAE